jgi:two-component system response regulator AtoC
MPDPLSVLLAEDDDPLRDVLSDLIRSWGWQVHGVGHGGEAFELARRVRFDFSILDLHLPGMTGLELLRAIRHSIGPLPSILMSGQASPDETRQALAAGAFTFLRKPLALDALRASVFRLASQHFGIDPSADPRSRPPDPPPGSPV